MYFIFKGILDKCSPHTSSLKVQLIQTVYGVLRQCCSLWYLVASYSIEVHGEHPYWGALFFETWQKHLYFL